MPTLRAAGVTAGRALCVPLAALVAAATLAWAPVVAAQGTVQGVVTVLERAGAPTNDLAHAVVSLIPGEAGDPPPPAPAAAPAVASIAMRTKEFQPRVRVVVAGGAVAFPNRDPFSHNVFSNAPLASFDLGLYRRGASRAARFPHPGVYPVYCNIHARMVAFVVAVATSHHAQPDARGRFALVGVPAGSYRLRVWHERGGEATVALRVPPAGVDSVRVTLDARAYMYAPHPDKFGAAYAPERRDRY